MRLLALPEFRFAKAEQAFDRTLLAAIVGRFRLV